MLSPGLRASIRLYICNKCVPNLKTTDLVTWGREGNAAKAVLIPDHHASFNTRTAMVAGNANAQLRDALPEHQAVMVLEPRSDHAFLNTSFRYAINTGSDGDLSANWQLLPASGFGESGFYTCIIFIRTTGTQPHCRALLTGLTNNRPVKSSKTPVTKKWPNTLGVHNPQICGGVRGKIRSRGTVLQWENSCNPPHYTP